MGEQEFVETFGGIVEHSAFIAERAFLTGVLEPLDAQTVGDALITALRHASREEQLQILNAHPDLAGRLALAGDLTADSKAEQASAGLDRLTQEELATFTALNDTYRATFGFPFIIAVKGLTKEEILEAFQLRVENTYEEEFETALREVERIVAIRLKGLFEA
ncbi:MAG: 2-oxo-4-hydroxy-4-carboxy-5-ureidoimidazoline decarboxylase [Pseudomonadota bacterium]